MQGKDPSQILETIQATIDQVSGGSASSAVKNTVQKTTGNGGLGGMMSDAISKLNGASSNNTSDSE